jgi:hypothetical protein
MHTNYKYYNYRGYWINPPAFVYRLDAGKTPKQIDIGVAKDSVRIKGIYVLDGDELRLCLAQPDKDRPAAFPEKPAPGEVLILQRQKPAAEQPKAKGEAPAAKKVLTPEEAIKQMPKENVTVEFKVASVELDFSYLYSGFNGAPYLYLKDGGTFTAALICRESAIHGDQLKKLGIEKYEDFKGKTVRVTGRVESLNMKGASPKGMFVRSVADIEVVQPKPDGKEQKPNEEKQPVPKELSAEQPKAKGGPPDAKKVLTPEEAIKQMPKENVTVQFKVASVHRPDPTQSNHYGPPLICISLRDGGKFTAVLLDHALALGRSEDLTGKMVRVTGRVEPDGDALFRMVVRDANNIEVVKE